MNSEPVTTKRKLKIPAFYLHHWKDGKPASCFTDGKMPPKNLATDWFVSFHPEQEVEINEVNVAEAARPNGVFVAKQIDMSKFIPVGSKLSWNQRIKGII